MVRELASKRGGSLTEATKQAVTSYMRDDPERIRERLETVKAIQDEIASLPKMSIDRK